MVAPPPPAVSMLVSGIIQQSIGFVLNSNLRRGFRWMWKRIRWIFRAFRIWMLILVACSCCSLLDPVTQLRCFGDRRLGNGPQWRRSLIWRRGSVSSKRRNTQVISIRICIHGVIKFTGGPVFAETVETVIRTWRLSLHFNINLITKCYVSKVSPCNWFAICVFFKQFVSVSFSIQKY